LPTYFNTRAVQMAAYQTLFEIDNPKWRRWVPFIRDVGNPRQLVNMSRVINQTDSYFQEWQRLVSNELNTRLHGPQHCPQSRDPRVGQNFCYKVDGILASKPGQDLAPRDLMWQRQYKQMADAAEYMLHTWRRLRRELANS